MTWYIIMMFWSTSGEPHFMPGWEPVQIEQSDCQEAGRILWTYAEDIVARVGGRFKIGCIGAWTPEEMSDLMVEGFNIKKGLPL